MLKPGFHGIGLVVLVCAVTLTELAGLLSGQPRLPRRDPTCRYWPL
ncbi:hypothetical protein NI17_011595 [Thermobifida halotolerans]|uniref:Uncharacterized protein n=1 Tax=Thermobifida halotolerans TaxID=483545 RepID=A0AA97M128_9ACTN|nr:hypothetical protein [Thermobifida halotolerans]UOE21681.1 hypothetical protein NI17_011595 [Thermobifida halotolerans]